MRRCGWYAVRWCGVIWCVTTWYALILYDMILILIWCYTLSMTKWCQIEVPSPKIKAGTWKELACLNIYMVAYDIVTFKADHPNISFCIHCIHQCSCRWFDIWATQPLHITTNDHIITSVSTHATQLHRWWSSLGIAPFHGACVAASVHPGVQPRTNPGRTCPPTNPRKIAF